jgi:hypothetical protein
MKVASSLNYLSPLSAVDDDDGEGHDEDDGETDGQDEDDEPHEEADRGGGLRLRRVCIDLLKIGRTYKNSKSPAFAALDLTMPG